jgi:hypothetical protein
MPIEVTRHNYYWRHESGEFRVYLGRTRIEAMKALPEAQIKAEEIARARFTPPPPAPPKVSTTDPWKRVKTVLYCSMRNRALLRGDGGMSKEEFDGMWERAGGRCELTGLLFKLTVMKGRSKRPWAPSVDRIDCTKGYTAENCRLVCTAVNLAMNEWGEDTLRRIAKALTRKQPMWRPKPTSCSMRA